MLLYVVINPVIIIKYGICLHPRKKNMLLDDIGQRLLERAVELVKSGYKFVFVLTISIGRKGSMT